MVLRIEKTWKEYRQLFLVGVAPFDTDQNEVKHEYRRTGWYYDCFNDVLCSGPPHSRNPIYKKVMYYGKYYHKSWEIGVVMDTLKGELSFVLDGINYGPAYTEIPLDRPLVPCFIFKKGTKEFSVQITSEKPKDNPVDNFISVPSDITVMNTT